MSKRKSVLPEKAIYNVKATPDKFSFDKVSGGKDHLDFAVMIYHTSDVAVRRFQEPSGASTDVEIHGSGYKGKDANKITMVCSKGAYVIKFPDGSEKEFVADHDGVRVL